MSIAAKFKQLPLQKRIQLVLALLITLALLISVPTVAWFSYQKRAAKLQKIDAPNTLFLTAAHREDSTCLEINGIDAEEDKLVYSADPGDATKIAFNPTTNLPVTETVPGLDGNNVKITHQDYVFNVTGDAVDDFTIQLAYTTNNPFTYEIYAADELNASELKTELQKKNISGTGNNEIDYVAYELTGEPVRDTEGSVVDLPDVTDDSSHKYHTDAAVNDRLYYLIHKGYSETDANGIYTGRYLNSTDGTAADNDAGNTILKKSYDNYTTNIHSDARPVYWQAEGIKAFPGSTNANKKPFSRHFILRVKWQAGSLDNTDKETDIIYITVKATN